MTASDSRLRDASLILIACILIAYFRWLKLDTLVWGDPARWLSEVQRFARGQVPYRDFSWQFPPFALMLLGWPMRWFGETFAVVQMIIDLVSLTLALLAYNLIRPLLPRFLHLPAILTLLAICSTSLMFFNMFSFLTYVPALQTGAAGLLLLLGGLLSYWRTGRLGPAEWICLGLGAFIAEFSKPESMLAAFATLGIAALLDLRHWFRSEPVSKWLKLYAALFLVCVVPAIAAYAWTAQITGLENMLEGNKGYGAAGYSCPWWPTGVGLLGASAALGEASGVAALLSLTRRRYFAARFGNKYSWGLAAGLAGLSVWGAYVAYLNWPLLSGSRPFVEKIWYSAPSTLWTSAVLMPVMWASIAVWLWLGIRVLSNRGGSTGPAETEAMLLLTGPITMSARGLFGTTLDAIPAVPGICYPFFILIGPYLMWRFLASAGPGPDLDRGLRGRPGVVIAVGLTTYALLRIGAAYPGMFSGKDYRTIATAAGDIRLSNYEADSQIYRFVMENTSASDYLVDVPYGGGMNFATGRLSPLFDTKFRGANVLPRFRQKDLEMIRLHPPKVVIGLMNEAHLGALYGELGYACEFPKILWMPSSRGMDPSEEFAAIRYIEENYQVVKTIGARVLLMPKTNRETANQ